MNEVKVRDIVIGSGIPKIIVPLVSETDSELLEEMKEVISLKPDMVEWRVDFYDNVERIEAVIEMLKLLRDGLSETPLLFTFRSHREGGKKELPTAYYQQLIHYAIHSNLIDLVDVELLTGDEIVATLVDEAKANGTAVILSNHDFSKTPSEEEIINRLRKMQELGADILKIAVMPQSEEDVLTLLNATNRMKRDYAKQPLITMSMAGKGVLSRMAGELIGSAATFASGKHASAPGQIPINELRVVLDILHRRMN